MPTSRSPLGPVAALAVISLFTVAEARADSFTPPEAPIMAPPPTPQTTPASTTPPARAPAPRTAAVPYAATPGAPLSDEACARIPRCRLARFRRRLDEQRRQEYLRAVEDEARMMDERMYHTRTYRQRYPYEVDLLVISNLVLAGVLTAYAPTSWLRFEGFVGNYTQSGYSYDSSSGGGFTNVNGPVYGAQARVLPIKYALSPYAGVGLAFVNGSVNSGSTGTSGGAQANYLTVGAGAELTVPYFHLAVGYQFSEPFYAQAVIAGVHDDGLTTALQTLLNNNRHGVNVEVGVAF